MLLKYFYDESLAHASYVVGCQRAEVAIVIDPGRDIAPYLDMASREGLKLIAVAETHIHADYVSGARELAEQTGAKLYVSDEGPADWKYLYVNQYKSQLLKDGDSFSIGKIKFEVMHSPGHTPESVSFILIDQGGGADQPMGIFTGDFVFVGSIGRPDLLEEAAGIQGSAEAGAHDLFRSVQRFNQLPDFLQVWPAHGSGSACGKGLGAIPSSTVGYEKLFNPALQFQDESEFVRYILSDQPEAPKYFAVMKRVNKEGPKILGEVKLPEKLDIDKIVDSSSKGATLLDLRPASEFAARHIVGALNIPLPMLAAWAGWLIDYSKPLVLISSPLQLPEAVRVLHKIGLDQLEGYFDATEVSQSGNATQSYASVSPRELAERIEAREVTLVDVRSDTEWNSGHIANAQHLFLGRLPDFVANIPSDQIVVSQCQSGVRSAIAASVLQAAGKDVVDLAGGYMAWVDAGLPISQPSFEGETTCQVNMPAKKTS